MNYKAICLTISIIFAASSVCALEICGDLKQGEIIVGKVKDDANSVLINQKHSYPITEDGYFIFALNRDEGKQAELLLAYPNNARTIYKLPIAANKWDIQRINGVNQQKVTPDSSNDAEISREQKEVRGALKIMQPGDFWREGFIIPVDGRISGNFGNQRIFNGTPKSPHTGTDIAAAEETPVKASAGGKVILNGKDYFYSGNTVIIDHGQGLQTIYAHLKTSNVKNGDIVKQGQIIGLVGHTGRATGSHLHWGASLNNVRFRPHSLLDINNKKCRNFDGQHIGK